MGTIGDTSLELLEASLKLPVKLPFFAPSTDTGSLSGEGNCLPQAQRVCLGQSTVMINGPPGTLGPCPPAPVLKSELALRARVLFERKKVKVTDNMCKPT